MGCGESKHAVATQNTISKNPSKRSNSIKKTNQETDPRGVEKKGTNDGNPDGTPVQESASVAKDSGNGKVKENEVPDKVQEKELRADKGKETENAAGKKENDVEGKDETPEGKVKENDVVEGKEINGEAKPETEIKEESPMIDEGKVVEPVDETKSSATTVEEKTPAAEEKNDENAPSVDDAKAV